MYDIKHYKSDNHSLSNGQVLPRPYKYNEACLVLREMIDILCCDKLHTSHIYSTFHIISEMAGPIYARLIYLLRSHLLK